MEMIRPLAEKRIADINGSTLEYVVGGNGRPVIVLINGYGSNIDFSWGGIFQEAKAISRVFAYNRFGYGKSGRVEVPQTGNVIVRCCGDSEIGKRPVHGNKQITETVSADVSLLDLPWQG